jgi:2-succinyl-6-hydroxy-2,4-cyclohexadiene-1-carboxylate synthase
MGPLICLHGFLGGPADWDFLRDEWDVRAPELLPDRDLESWGDDLAPGELLIGYSLGARLALHALLRHPERWRGAILIGANPGLEWETTRAERRARDYAWAERFRYEDWNTVLADWNAQPVFAGSEIPARDDGNREKHASMLELWSLGRQRAKWGELAQLRTPVLWLAGDRDEKFRGLAERAAAITGRLVIVPGAGHRVPWDAPEAIKNSIRHFWQ